MKSEWKVYSLSDHIEIKHGFAFIGEHITKKETNNVLLTPGNFSIGGGFKSNKFKYYDTNEFPDEYILKENDLIVTMTDLSKAGDTLGYPAKVPAAYGKNYLHNQRLGLINFITTDLDKDFLYWLLRTRGYQKFIVNSATGSTVKHTSPTRILEYSFNAPKDVQDQKKVASILTVLENKIELNHKMNQTLEEMAQTLFKSWFVDFEPVHAKANANSDTDFDRIAKELSISREVLDLFPDEFKESEFGTIPKGWKVTQLGECDFTIESGKRPKGGIDKELKNGTPSVGAESISPIGVFDYSKEKNVTNSFAKSIKSGKIHDFDVVLYKDGARLSDSQRLNDKLSIYGEGFPYKDFFINEHIYILRSKELGQFFLYFLMTSKNTISHLVNCATGKAAQPGLNQTEVKDVKFFCPDPVLLDVFNSLVSPMVRKQLNNGSINKDLSKLRDTLLPKLLSGEVDVSELELDNVTH